MGKHLWMRHLNDESHDKQPGCLGGLFHVLDYHHWQSNVRKRIQQRKYDGQIHDRCKHSFDQRYMSSRAVISYHSQFADWSPEEKVYRSDAYETEKLLDEKETPNISSTKRSRETKKRSLKARIKALIAEDIQSKQGFSIKSSLRRTYSIHHLESLDDDIAKICTDWQNPTNFVPANAAKMDSKEDPDVLDIFKVDKELFIRHLQDSDESVANFFRSALGSKVKKAKFSKSRSFPVSELSERKKLKPLKLENKRREVWSFPIESKSQTVYRDHSGYFDTSMLGQDTLVKVDKQINNLSKYAELFENTFETDAKLNASKSMKLTNEYGHAPMYFRRIHSLSNVDSYYSNPNNESLSDGTSGNGSAIILKDRNFDQLHDEVEKAAGLFTSDNKENVPSDANMQIKESDVEYEKEGGFKEKAEKHNTIDQISEGLTNVPSIHEPSFPIDNDEVPDKTIISFARNAFSQNNFDLYYVRHLLDQSGIVMDASEMTWHVLDQPLSPKLFEQVEGCWPDEQDPLNVWHHQMVFDLVNEVLVEVFDLSLPYYPRALASSCYVRPFPVGTHIIEEVCTSIGKLVSLKPEEKQLLECIVGRDLARDHAWMNLQLESECIALDLEDLIFNELIEEVIFS